MTQKSIDTMRAGVGKIINSVTSRIIGICLLVLTAPTQAKAQQHNNCWLRERNVYSFNLYGSNPSVADFHVEIRALAVLYKVPVEIIGAVCHQESVGGYQYDADGYSGPGHVGTGFVVHNIGECEYAYSTGYINSNTNLPPPPGLGLMQLTSQTALDTGRLALLITDWRVNLEEGVKVLVKKYNAALAVGDDPSWMEQLEKDNMHVLENWFYGLRYYNGYKSQAKYPTAYLVYLDAVYGKIASLPSNGRLNGLFSPVMLTKPASVIGGWADGKSFVALPTGEWKDKDNTSFSGSVHVSGGGTTVDKAALTTLVIPPQPITLASPRLLLDGPFQFSFIGESNRTFTVQASSDLTTWITLTNLTSISGAGSFADSDAKIHSQRFYRILRP